MSLITRCQRQTVVYWPLIGNNQYGEPVWGPPQQLTCRWDDKSQQIVDPKNTLVVSRAELIIQTEVAVGGIIIKGTLDTVAYWSDPKANLGAYEVLKVSSTPNIRNTETLYEAWV
ncbi:MAG: hypothetical protein ACK5S6_05070 [bacterium]|jgi:hypothetical protein